mmetsp:Transcript_16594/g.31440  ORF Transcript_16594/g.31440 Transcript_16594/m.31440 type:complete len:635 (+) Transcript_16594:107-2011(+)
MQNMEEEDVPNRTTTSSSIHETTATTDTGTDTHANTNTTSNNENSTPEKRPPQTLQELVADNVLIDALVGITAATSPSVHDHDVGGTDDTARLDQDMLQFMSSIESCTDIEMLVQDIEKDLEEFTKEDSMEEHPARTQESSSRMTEVVGGDFEPRPDPDCTFLAARLARIKSLLYNERSTSTTTTPSSFFASSSSSSSSLYNPLFFFNSSSAQSQQQQQQQHKTNASALVHSLLLNSKRKQIMIFLLEYLNELPFETRKDVASIFNYLLVCGCILDGQEEQTFASGGGSGGGGGGGGRAASSSFLFSLSSSKSHHHANHNNDSVTLSYIQTMLRFVEYVDEYYAEIMKHIVQGHYVAGSIQNSGVGSSTGGNGTKAPPPSIKTVDVALHCGTMLRSTLRHVKLYANLIQPHHTANFVYPFLNVFTNQSNFEVASDALETLRLILHPNIHAIAVPSFAISTTATTNTMSSLDIVQARESLESMMEMIAATFLEREYEPIFVQRFNVLLLSAEHANYITRRVSLQILSAVLLTRSNYNVMIKYVSSRSNLKTIMMLLSDSSAQITLEAFHVFKIFVANPNKPLAIVRILADNKVKLVKYLTGLHRDKEVMDEQFRDEKALVISTLQEIEYKPSDGS